MNNNTFAGLPTSEIQTFFQQSNIYQLVLRRFSGISATRRMYIQLLETDSLEELEERLATNEEFAQFVRDMTSRYLRGTDNEPRSSDVGTITNHEFRGIPVARILSYIVGEADTVRAYGLTHLTPLLQNMGASEFERLLATDATLQALVIANQAEIEAAGVVYDTLPPAADILMYFNRSSNWSVLLVHLSNPSYNNRSIVERIRSLSPESLTTRLEWDLEIRTFVTGCAENIRQYADTGYIVSDAKLAKQDFINKLKRLQSKLDRNGYGEGSGRTHEVTIDRSKLLRESYTFLMSTSAKRLRSSRCSISWKGEEGLDYGGPKREFFFRLSRQLFNPYYGLFEYSAQGSYTIQISPHAPEIQDFKQWFRFAGRLIGYAIIQGQLLDVFFARHIYKALLGKKCQVSDMEAIDIGFYNSLKYVQDNDPEPLDLNFSVLEETFGEMSDYELKPGGAGILVDNSNKHEYIELLLNWRLSRGTGQQTESLVKGMREMIPLAYLDPFDAQELEWVIAGTPEIDLEDWKKNTDYRGGYHKNHKVIKWFWKAVEEFSNEQKLRLLQFVTGTSSIPFEGFKALRGSGTIQKFNIDSGGNSSYLPIAHTCFNRLDLPDYRTFEDLYHKLIIAVEECETFENA